MTELSLKSAFVPFGPVKEVNIPLDHETGKHRGFGFVEFEEREDAADAIDNMHNGELFGRCAHIHIQNDLLLTCWSILRCISFHRHRSSIMIEHSVCVDWFLAGCKAGCCWSAIVPAAV